MVLKPDQERLKTLLRDTITLLCKNGLTFHSEFSIEALIGITLDKDDVILVSIKENVGTGKVQVEARDLDEGTSMSQSPGERKKARKRRIKSEDTENYTGDEGAPLTPHSARGHDESSGHLYAQGDQSSFVVTDSESSTAKRKRPTEEPSVVSHLKQEVNDDDDDDDSITFIKQEAADTWETSAESTDFTMENFTAYEASQNVSGNEQWLGPSQQDSRVPQAPGTSGFSGATPSSSAGQHGQMGAGPDESVTQEFTEEDISRLVAGKLCCRLCGESFWTKVDLNIHMRRHSGEHVHSCEECGKGCLTKYSLDRHMVSHTGVKMFTCHICSRSYRHKTHLNTHIKRKHNGVA